MSCKSVVAIPCPNATVASLHLPHFPICVVPISSVSNVSWFNIPIFTKKSSKLSIPTFWAIRTDPIFPDLIKICSAVKFEGILLSYSSIEFLLQVIFFFRPVNSVFGLTTS